VPLAQVVVLLLQTNRTASDLPVPAFTGLVTGADAKTVMLTAPPVPTRHPKFTSPANSVVPSARMFVGPGVTLGAPEAVAGAPQAVIWPYDAPANKVAKAARPKSLFRKFDIPSPCEFVVLESVEVLCNLSLNYNECFGTTLRELLRVGRRYGLPAFLERSAKAVHLEGCGPLN
jgi:hypothetical protein